jgi:hypothetical protein
MTLRPDLLLKLYLLDISQPMLNIGYRHAADALGEYPNVFIAGMQGNFHDLPCYQHLFYAPKSRPTCRVFVMIGGTMNNIDNELRFCRHSLATAAVGDLLLLSVQCAHTEQLNDAAIRRAEPAMQKPFPALHAKWLSTPIRHYCDDASDIQFRNVVRLDCIIPGSYAIDAVARVRFKDGRSRDISMCRFKRYNSEKFAESLRTEGWERIEEQSVRLTDEQSVKASFMLFRKVAMPENGLDPTADAAPSGPKS